MQYLSANFLVVGAGITGLTIARELLIRGAEDIVLIEKEPRAGVHASGRNSGVLHAGIYYTPDSLKAKYCLEGNRLMKEYCREKGLKLKETGKVVLAITDKEHKILMELKRRADACGAKNELVDSKMLKEIEPHAGEVLMALYSPETAVVDPVEILNSLVKELTQSTKVRILFSTEFKKIKDDSVAVAGEFYIKFKRFINSAGAHADKIAHMFFTGRNLRILPFKGTYKKLRPAKDILVRGNIYPVPDINNPFLGVHFTRSVDDIVYIGPTAIPALSRENYGLFRGIDTELFPILWRNALLFINDGAFRKAGIGELKKYFARFVYRDAKKLVPELLPDDILPSEKMGIRPQLIDIESRKLVMDFIVIEDGDAIHILNAISPAFTSSMAFARWIVKRII